jgi:tetratricopeptide (TPR) repeat protein
MQFTIVNICPPQGNHYALAEIEETLYFGLRALGYDCEILEPMSLYTLSPMQDRQYIILGCNSNPLYEKPFPLPANSILYNFEQIYAESPWLRAGYIDYLCQYPVWDYSLANIETLKRLGIAHVAHVPVGYVPEMTRIALRDDRDIDVLFYGSINDRRQHILDQLENKGVRVKTLFGVYGAERDQYIARSKIILNMHFYGAKVFEIVRVSYLLANGAFVISEESDYPEEEAYFRDGVVFTPYENLVDCCLDYLVQDSQRKCIAERGFQQIQSCSVTDYLRQGIQSLPLIYEMVNPSGIFIRDFYRKYLAKNAFYQGNYQQAIVLYEETLQVDPACLESYWNLGLVLRCLGDELTGDMIWSSALDGLELEDLELEDLERDSALATDRLANLHRFLQTERQRQIDLRLHDRHPEILKTIEESLALITPLSPENETI